MRAILAFKLPQERCEFNIASRAMDWALTVSDIDEKLRGWLKYGHQFSSADEALEATRDYLRSVLDGRCISLDEIE